MERSTSNVPVRNARGCFDFEQHPGTGSLRVMFCRGTRERRFPTIFAIVNIPNLASRRSGMDVVVNVSDLLDSESLPILLLSEGIVDLKVRYEYRMIIMIIN